MAQTTPQSKDSQAGVGPESEFARSSSLYQEFLAEREEILRHKWLESEKAGRDIGFERALLDWIRQHRDLWRQGRPKGGPTNGSQNGRATNGSSKKVR